jgi:glycyl-tRNA synthetase
MALSIKFARLLGIPSERQRFEEKMPTERAHYSAQTFDHQVWLDRWGWVELGGHAYRTDFDLSAHIKSSGVDLSIFKPYEKPVEKQTALVVPLESILGPILREKTKGVVDALLSKTPDELRKAFDAQGYFEIQGFKILPSHVRFEDKTVRETGRRIVPHVVEPSYGAERSVYSTLEYAYSRVNDRVVLKLPLGLTPIQLMVFPLMAKDGLPEIALEIQSFLTGEGFDVDYDDAGTIGRRYARADEIGVPLTITVDYQTKTDETVTVRDRDTWKQVRNSWKRLPELAHSYFRSTSSFDSLGAPFKVDYE